MEDLFFQKYCFVEFKWFFIIKSHFVGCENL